MNDQLSAGGCPQIDWRDSNLQHCATPVNHERELVANTVAFHRRHQLCWRLQHLTSGGRDDIPLPQSGLGGGATRHHRHHFHALAQTRWVTRSHGIETDSDHRMGSATFAEQLIGDVTGPVDRDCKTQARPWA